ncbi:hypothetical protein [Bifidobacterium thermophilum]|uniref:Uncharacterized protein n=1 Tax=Bifidobacterium thermophilum TaxID=33905 RepID=A0A7X9RME7_9BIFI|nr:hypothetical protein [Bifidobacterium thermophilum]NME61516.1 hypothetical protein [Bifidobacterium thermophilum]
MNGTDDLSGGSTDIDGSTIDYVSMISTYDPMEQTTPLRPIGPVGTRVVERIEQEPDEHTQARYRVSIRTLAALMTIILSIAIGIPIYRAVQRNRWQNAVADDVVSTMEIVDDILLQNHGNTGFVNGDVSCPDPNTCFLTADSGVITKDALNAGTRIPMHAGDSITIRHNSRDGAPAYEYIVIGENVHLPGSCIYHSSSGEMVCDWR